MRNVIIASCLLATASSVLVYQRGALAKTRAEVEGLIRQSASLEGKISAERANLEDFETRRVAQKRALAGAEERLKEVRAAQIPVTEWPDPAKEGHWPGARPYFYMAKKHIPTIDYDAVTGTGRVTSEAAALFGMTAKEKGAINEGIEALFQEIRRAEMEGAYRTNTPVMVEHQKKGEKISVFLPANARRDEMSAGLAKRIVEVLGTERAPLFLDRAQELRSRFDSFSPEDRVVTMIPKDENTGEVITTTKWGSSYYFYDRTREQDYVRFQYDHLLEAFVFGSEK